MHTWEFAFDFGCSAVERRLWEKETFDREILVPFCPESKLSGIGYTDFISGVAYRRTFTLSQEELAGKVLLHFGAVDYEATVYVNGELAGTHKGGYTSFTLDITRQARLGENSLFVAVRDDVRSGLQPKGKQAHLYASSGCDYTRTTGIWQTVWLEFVPQSYIQYAKYYPPGRRGADPLRRLGGPPCGAEVPAGKGRLLHRPAGAGGNPPVGARQGRPLHLGAHLWGGPGAQLLRPAGRPLPGEEVPGKRQVPVPADGVGPGLLSRRHLHRPHRGGPDSRHSAVLRGGL